MRNKKQHVDIRPRRSTRKVRWPDWLWLWREPAEFVIPAARIYTSEYEADLINKCKTASIDEFTAHVFDNLIDQDAEIDIRHFRGDHSLRSTVLLDQREEHTKRRERAERWKNNVKQRLDEEVKSLEDIDEQLASRRPPRTTPTQLPDSSPEPEAVPDDPERRHNNVLPFDKPHDEKDEEKDA